MVFTHAVSALSADCIRLTRTQLGATDEIWQPFYDSMAESGICLNILDVPAKRAISMFQSGESDGEFLQTPERLKSLGPNAVLVPEPLHHGIGLFVTRQGSGITPDSQHHIHIGHLRGEGWTSNFAANYDHAIEVTGYDSGLLMLKAGRLDVFLIDDFRWNQRKHMQEGLITKEVGRGSAHMLLHKRFAPKMDAIIQAIQTAKRGRASYLDYYLEQYHSQ